MSAPATTARFVVHDPEFESVLGDHPRIERVVACDAHEGPVYVDAEDALYFTSVPGPGPRMAIRRIALDGDRFPVAPDRISTVREDANAANGMAPDNDGRLLVCEQGSATTAAAVTRLDRGTGRVEVLVDAWQGRPLSSPNDVVAASDGAVWFTDPTYGHLQGFRPEPATPDRVYRYDPARQRAEVADESLCKPNGLAFSPDERTLYVTDSGANQEPGSYYPSLPHRVVAFDVLPDGGLGPARPFADVAPGFPDGIKVDDRGRVYASSASGVKVFEPGGWAIGEIALPGVVNFAFGGPGRNVLFMTTDDAVWAAVLAATGPSRPRGA